MQWECYTKLNSVISLFLINLLTASIFEKITACGAYTLISTLALTLEIW